MRLSARRSQMTYALVGSTSIVDSIADFIDTNETDEDTHTSDWNSEEAVLTSIQLGID